MNNQNERITVESKEITTESGQNKSAQEKATEPDLATRLAIAEKEVAELRSTIATLLNPRGPTPYQTNSDHGPYSHGGHYNQAAARENEFANDFLLSMYRASQSREKW